QGKGNHDGVATGEGSKLPIPNSKEAPSSKLKNRPAFGPDICFSGLVFGIWNFSGAWGLVLGVSLRGGSIRDGCRPCRRLVGHRRFETDNRLPRSGVAQFFARQPFD